MKKYFIYIIVLCILLISGFVGFKYLNYYFDKKAFEIRTEYLNATKSIVASEIIANNKLLKEEILKLDSKITAFAKSENAKIHTIGKVVASIQRTLEKSESDHVYKPGSKDPNEQYFKKILLTDAEGKQFPIAGAFFYPNRKEQWKVVTYPDWKLNVDTVLMKGDTEKAFTKVWFENPQFAETKGKQYPMEIASSKWVTEKPKEKKFSWNPRLALNLTYDVENVYPGLTMSMFSYGLSKSDSNFKFLDIGVGVDKDSMYGVFSPVSYNMKFLPFVENLFVGPTVSYDINELKIGVSLSVPM